MAAVSTNESNQETRSIRVLVNGKSGQLTLSLSTAVENVDIGAKAAVSGSLLPSTNSHHANAFFLHTISVYYVISAKVDMEERTLSFAYLRHDNKLKKHATLVQNVFTLPEETSIESAQEWCKTVIELAFDGVTTPRRLKVIVNPHSGKGKSVSIYNDLVQPILSLADCKLDTTFTERSKHATDIARSLPLDYDAIVICSGDGILHEIYNGFAEHDDPMRAFSIPIAPVPTGSANGTCLNLLGLEAGFDPALATLNAIKGKPMRLDISSVTMGDQRIFSYMTQAMGLMADVDLGTEHLRWMGDARFALGFVVGAMKMKPFPMTLEIKTAETNKDKMVDEFRARSEAYRHQLQLQRDGAVAEEIVSVDVGNGRTTREETETGNDGLPTLKHTEEPHEDQGWMKFEKPILYLYAGKSPWVARDLMQFPVAHPSDGYIDVVVQETIGRLRALSLIDGAEKGNVFFQQHQHYYKAHAYRVTPHTTASTSTSKSSHNWLSIDGEHYQLTPGQPFTVECHYALGALLSPTPGLYAHAEVFEKAAAAAVASKTQARSRHEPDANPLLGTKSRKAARRGESIWMKLTGWC